jgi:hypothetical protein
MVNRLYVDDIAPTMVASVANFILTYASVALGRIPGLRLVAEPRRAPIWASAASRPPN